jgi:hypothetical protein
MRNAGARSKSRIFLMPFIGMSLLLNVYLATHLWGRKPAASAAPVSTAHKIDPAEIQAQSSALKPSQPLSGGELDGPTFHWSEVESRD